MKCYIHSLTAVEQPAAERPSVAPQPKVHIRSPICGPGKIKRFGYGYGKVLVKCE